MKESLFYIFASVSLAAAIFAAFSAEIKTSLKAAVYFMSGITGLLLLLNFHLFSLFSVLFSLLLFSLFMLLKDRVTICFQDTGAGQKVNFVSLLLISLLTAVLAGLTGAAKWPQFAVIRDSNSLSLIFSKYSAAVIAVCLLISVLVSSAFSILKNGDTE